jgi:uncharacterized protein CbrC (UPF0167 family)
MVPESFPAFTYHPDPIATGSIVRSTEPCACCGRIRGYVYVSSIYGRERPRESFCPWCISSGDAAARFDVFFAEGPPGVSAAVMDEISRRTPGYDSFQQTQWQSCCLDACEYHGDAPKDEVRALGSDDLARIAEKTAYPMDYLTAVARSYDLGGNPCIHKYVCRHCRRVHYDVDGT